MNFTAPFSDLTMTYNQDKHRYILTPEFVRTQGIDLNLILNKEASPIPSTVEELFLDRVSLLVYSNVYTYGRNREQKEYLMACNPNLREVMKEAMLERIFYIADSGDMSTRAPALIQQGVRIETRDLTAGPVELDILRSHGLLHRGRYAFQKDEAILY